MSAEQDPTQRPGGIPEDQPTASAVLKNQESTMGVPSRRYSAELVPLTQGQTNLVNRLLRRPVQGELISSDDRALASFLSMNMTAANEGENQAMLTFIGQAIKTVRYNDPDYETMSFKLRLAAVGDMLDFGRQQYLAQQKMQTEVAKEDAHQAMLLAFSDRISANLFGWNFIPGDVRERYLAYYEQAMATTIAEVIGRMDEASIKRGVESIKAALVGSADAGESPARAIIQTTALDAQQRHQQEQLKLQAMQAKGDITNKLAQDRWKRRVEVAERIGGGPIRGIKDIVSASVEKVAELTGRGKDGITELAGSFKEGIGDTLGRATTASKEFLFGEEEGLLVKAGKGIATTASETLARIDRTQVATAGVGAIALPVAIDTLNASSHFITTTDLYDFAIKVSIPVGALLGGAVGRKLEELGVTITNSIHNRRRGKRENIEDKTLR